MAIVLAPFPSAARSQTEVDEDEEEDNLASLMPNFFTKMLDNDDPGSTLDFQEIHRILSEETSRELPDKWQTSNEGGSANDKNPGKQTKTLLTTYSKRERKSLDSRGGRRSTGQYSGKENVPFNEILQRKRDGTRREGSGRTTTHRPFKFDLRSLGTATNEGVPRDHDLLQEVHAFWAAVEHREASEAIRRKIRDEAQVSETCNGKSISGNMRGRRHARMRRKGTGRRTISRAFDVELPQDAECVESWDEEQLEEEEEERPPPSSCVFVNSENQIKEDIMISQSHDVPADCIDELSSKQIQTKELFSSVSDPTYKSHGSIVEDQVVEVTMDDESNATPSLKAVSQNMVASFTPVTSPTPPSNPLAALGIRKKILGEGTGNRRLDFDNPMDFVSPEAATNAVGADTRVKQATNLVILPETTSETKKTQVAASDIKLVNGVSLGVSMCASTEKEEECSQQKYANHGPPRKGVIDEESSCRSSQNQFSTLQTNQIEHDQDHNVLSAHGQGATLSPFLEVSIDIRNHKKQDFDRSKLKNGGNDLVKKRKTSRYSLSGSGTRWDGGVRRSTRIKSRPLEYWRGERFLYGRVHKSLTTVIGIKYSSPPTCWPRRGDKGPNFKVKSFVSEEYADYVRFAAS